MLPLLQLPIFVNGKVTRICFLKQCHAFMRTSRLSVTTELLLKWNWWSWLSLVCAVNMHIRQCCLHANSIYLSINTRWKNAHKWKELQWHTDVFWCSVSRTQKRPLNTKTVRLLMVKSCLPCFSWNEMLTTQGSHKFSKNIFHTKLKDFNTII